jgi:hypothetical protein
MLDCFGYFVDAVKSFTWKLGGRCKGCVVRYVV